MERGAILQTTFSSKKVASRVAGNGQNARMRHTTQGPSELEGLWITGPLSRRNVPRTQHERQLPLDLRTA